MTVDTRMAATARFEPDADLGQPDRRPGEPDPTPQPLLAARDEHGVGRELAIVHGLAAADGPGDRTSGRQGEVRELPAVVGGVAGSRRGGGADHGRRLLLGRCGDGRTVGWSPVPPTEELPCPSSRINVLQVPEGRGEVLEQRFASRAGEVEKVDGFESFELLRPTEDFDRYLVVTRWRDEEAFQAWMSSMAFQQGHARSAEDAEAADGRRRRPVATPAVAPGGGHPGGGHRGGAPGGGPAAVGSELWSFDVVTSATKA